MRDLVIERLDLEISGKLDKDDECHVLLYNNVDFFLKKEEVQQVIDHLTLLLKV